MCAGHNVDWTLDTAYLAIRVKKDVENFGAGLLHVYLLHFSLETCEKGSKICENPSISPIKRSCLDSGSPYNACSTHGHLDCTLRCT